MAHLESVSREQVGFAWRRRSCQLLTLAVLVLSGWPAGEVAAQPGGLFTAVSPSGAAMLGIAPTAPDTLTSRQRPVTIDLGQLVPATDPVAPGAAAGIENAPRGVSTLNWFDDAAFTVPVERTAPAFSGGRAPSGRPAAAPQDVPDVGGRVYGLVGAGVGDGTFVATGVGAGLRLTPHLGLDVELAHLSDLGGTGVAAPWVGAMSPFGAIFAAGADLSAAEVYPPLENRGRDLTTFLTKITVEFPVAGGLLFPYLTGGGGVARVTEHSPWLSPIPVIPWEGASGDSHTVGSVDDDGSLTFDGAGVFFSPAAYSELGLALVLGGGVDVRLWRGFGVGGDIRWLRVLRGFDAIDTAQVAARVSYRF